MDARLFDVLQAVSAITKCGPGDIVDLEALAGVLGDGLVNCVDGRLTLTKAGADAYRCAREAQRGG